MLSLLLLLLYLWSHAEASTQSSDSAAQEGLESGQDGFGPNIYYCRSPDMETFTCWWNPLDNSLQGDDNITYRLVYTLGNRPPAECPDYVSGGPNSCYFDMEHTAIWEVYCMSVTAESSRGSFTSTQHCLDVAEIIEPDPPYNLTYTMNMTKGEAGCTVLVSWQYPIPQQVQTGWITLLYELRYRAVSKPNNWKVKERLRETRLELLELLVGRYEVQVRCRSKNNKLWSKWSSPIIIDVPSKHLPDDFGPNIYYCRSPDMETFTCWWNPLDNSLQGDDNITYRLVYTLGNRPPAECPDYVSGGPNSCYFDMEHTAIWEVYCMSVTAESSRGSFTSTQHCLDVAEIVEPDPPYNLTYTMNMTKGEAGCTVLVSWQYPIPQQVQTGWITLLYELRYRAVSKPNNWKVKERLRETQLELLELLVGRYEVQVRCRSKNNKLWSKWSSPIIIDVPSKHLPGHMFYALVLSTSIVIILLIIGLGVIPQGKRIKAFLLPPIPKPCIRGIDPMLLKKGKMDEINHHFSSLQGYKAPRYRGESVYPVSMDEDVLLSRLSSMSSIQEDQEPQVMQNPYCTEDQQLLRNPDISSPVYQDPSFCSKETSESPVTPETNLWVWPEKSPVQLSFPGMEYSILVNTPAPTNTSVPPSTQEFYTCVHGVTANEMVQLVPCMSDSLKGSAYCELKDKTEEDAKKLGQLTAFLEKRVEGSEMFYPEKPGQNEYVVPLLP